MKQYKAATPQLSEVDLALAEAIRLIARMDQSASAGRPIIVAELIVWALTKSVPSVIEPLVESGQVESLTGLLRDYAALRPIAESQRFNSYLKGCAEAGVDYDDNGYLTPEDMRRALESRGWRCGDPEARAAIARSLHFVLADSKDAEPIGRPHSAATYNVLENTHRNHVECPSAAQAADELDPVLQPALATAVAHARRELLTCDDGGTPDFWGKIYTSVLGDWLETDVPEVATEVLDNGLTSEYVKSVWLYVKQMDWVERFWAGLGHHIRDLLLGETDEVLALRLIGAVVNAGELHIEEHRVGAWSRRVWQMVQRRDSRAQKSADSLIASAESNMFLESVRSSTKGYDTGYLVDTKMLPGRFCGLTDERQVLVVRLPEDWLSALGEIESQPGLYCFWWEMGKDCGLSLSINRAFWCDYDELWSKLFKFRRSIPVLYVFETVCIFARYRFQHFSDLRAVADVPHKKRLAVDISGENWEHYPSSASWTATLPDGHRLKPSILSNLVDMTNGTGVGKLRQACLRENPDAGLSR
ncbi:hypothetical protein EHZ19_15925 [Paraburkholderia bannensis]|nr:hypothetical protein [Paraburkholderia bannensis]RQM47140.1 hypothetical protein EHZ19_15925 [Paraburkholderia bannensis]